MALTGSDKRRDVFGRTVGRLFKNNFLKNSIRINISVAIELVSVFFSF